MSSATDSHLRDLENELRDADSDVKEYRERSQRRIEEMNNEVAELVQKVQFEKGAIKEQLDRKEQWAKRKSDEVNAFKEAVFGMKTPSLRSGSSDSDYQTSSEANKLSINSVEDSTNGPPKIIEDLDSVSLVNGVLHDTSGRYSGYKYLPYLGIVCLRQNGAWCEIRCHWCGGNCIETGWVRGGRGMLAHCKSRHKIKYHNNKKLDSVNIVEICNHRSLSHDDVVACLAGTRKFDIIPCRGINSHTVDLSSTPRPNEKIPANDCDRDLPYDWLAKYPTIVMRRDGQWVELRCDVCKGNSFPNGDMRFAQGVLGFIRHFSRAHGIDPPNPSTISTHQEWTVQRCEYRVVPPGEILALTEETGAGAANGPPKVPFQNTKIHLEPAKTVPVKRQASKRSTEPLESESSDDTVEVNGTDDDDFNPDDAKRARYSMSAYSANRRGRKQLFTKTFACALCSRQFRRQETLNRHHMSLHMPEKPFECQDCGKKFSRSDNVTQHQRTHRE